MQGVDLYQSLAHFQNTFKARKLPASSKLRILKYKYLLLACFLFVVNDMSRSMLPPQLVHFTGGMKLHAD